MKEYFDLLGHECRDRVTGMTGIVPSVCFDLYGCVQVALTPKADAAGKIEDGRWFDHKRIEIIGARVMPLPVYETKKPGEEIGPAEKPAPRI